MFTGIISHLGKLVKVENATFSFKSSQFFCKRIDKGSSVAVNGVCLTVISKSGNDNFSINIIPETAKRTMLGKLKIGDVVNLELPVTASQLLSGHLVQGHIDGVGTIKRIQKEGNSRLLTITIPRNLGKYIVEKGSIAVNGISLTVIVVKLREFTVGIIPYTWNNTMLKQVKVSDAVNIELDILAKYLEKILASQGVTLRNYEKPKDIKIAIVNSSFRQQITKNLEKNCLSTLKEKGLKSNQVDIFHVPGSLEIPLTVKKVAKTGKYDAIITFGAIVKGKTYHFEQIANECVRGCMEVSLQYEIPVIFEVLAVYDIKDAIDRATRKNENKGVEGALTALEMIKIISKL